MGWFSRLIRVAAPIVGFAFGGPAGAAFGGAVGQAATGGNPIRGAIGGFAGGSLAQFAGFGAGVGGGGSALGFGGPAIGSSGIEQLMAASAGGGGGGVMSWLPSALGIGGGLLGLSQAREIGNLNADPFGGERQRYANELAALSADPSSITQRPGYQFGLDQGLIGRQRALAAGGYSGSGNEAIALEQYAQEYAGNYLNREQARLALLAGAQISPSFSPQIEAERLRRDSLGEIGGGIAALPRAA